MGSRTCVHRGSMMVSCDSDRNRWLELNLIRYLGTSAAVAVHVYCIVSTACEGVRAPGASAVARRGNRSCSTVRLSMAVSKEDTSGLMTKASAFIAKYAIEGGRVRLRPGDVGVHKKSRGGDYPAGLRAKELLVEMSRAGILQDEVDNHGYAVEEMPVKMILDSKDACITTTLEYNVQQCAKDELLSGIYDEPFNKVFHGLLAHNHVMTVCRAVIARQLWRLEDIQDMKITFCDEGGRLSLDLITSSVNCKQLGAIIRDGFLCNVLSWKMDVEETDAAAIISTAFNELSQAAMRTTELQAIQVLKGEIILQMSKDVGQAVAFETTVARVKSILGPAVDDPDIVQLFDFLISNGVGKKSYIDDFLHWTTSSINPNKRRLRFAAFVPINNMCPLPLSRCAVAKRAYRGKPTGGYCPNPEHAWGLFTQEQLTPLEELLRFFHVQCKDLLSGWDVKARLQLLGNVDIAAAQAFYLVAQTKKNPKKVNKDGVDAVRRAVLQATYQYANELSLHDNSPLIQSIPGKPEWIVFGAVDAPDPPPAVAATTKEVGAKEQVVTANVIHFDEASGMAMNQQEPNSSEIKKVPTVVEQALPWQAWQRVYAEPAAMHGADHGSAVAVLHTLSCGVDAETLPLEVCERNGRIHVRATRSIPANELMLPPSAANACSLVDPHTQTTALAVDIAVRVQRNSMQAHGPTPREQSVEPAKKRVKKADKKPDGEKKADTDDDGEPAAEYLTERFFKLVSEWKVPALTTTADQATKAASAQCSCSDTVDGNSLWPPVLAPVHKVERSIDDYAWGDPASVRGFCKTTAAMSVYWAVRRLSRSDLEQANKLRSKKQLFNCRFEQVRIVNVSVGQVNKRAVNQTRNIEVPFITNTTDVEAGEELLLEKPTDERRPAAKPTGSASKWKTEATKSVKKAEARKGSHHKD